MALTNPGDIYGSWSVLRDVTSSGARVKAYLCKCLCGKEKTISGKQLRSGKSKSCGCQRRNNLRHGYTRAGKIRAEWQAWNHARQRCTNPKDKHYVDYGARGIKVCERWMNSFDNFIADMGDKPSPKHSLDRIDLNGDYTPENCRWATPEQQAQNKRSNRNVTFNGETHCTAEWARRTGIERRTIQARLKRGWPLDRVFAPVGGRSH